MPKYKITAPDGNSYNITAPEGASQEQALEYFKSNQPQKSTEPHPNAIMRGAAERMLGAEELINNIGIGKHIGLPENAIIEDASKELQQQGRDTGVTGFLGEMAGDPLSWMGGGEYAAAKGALQTAKVGGKYGAIAGLTNAGTRGVEDKDKKTKTLSGNIKSGAEGGIFGAAIPGGMSWAGKNAGLAMEGFSARGVDQLKEDALKIFSEGNNAYKTMRAENAGLTPAAIKEIQNSVSKGFGDNILNKSLHTHTVSVLNQAFKDIQQSGGTVSLDRLDQYRRMLSAASRVGNSEDRKMASMAIKSLDEAVNNLKPEMLTTQSKKAVDSLNQARAAWNKARKFESIVDIEEKAAGDPNRRKVLLQQLLDSKKRTFGFTKEEKDAIREAAQNNTAESLTKMFGKFGITLGNKRAAGTGNVIPAAELLFQGPKGLLVVLGGAIAKGVQNQIGKAKMERLLRQIEKGKGITATEEAEDALKALPPPNSNVPTARP